MTSSIPKFSIQNRPSAFIFSILLSLSLFYPYFSYDPVLSPLICLLSVVFAIILSFKHPNASSIQWGLLYLLFMSLGFWNMDSAALSNKSIILLITRVSFFYSSSILCDSESNKKIIISILMGLGTVISLYGLWQYIHIFPASLKFYSQFHEFIPDEIKHDPGKWKAFWVKLNNTRVYSIFSTPNMLGGFLLMTLPFFLLPFQNIMKPFPSRRFLKPLFLYGFLAFIPVLTLILTRSRSALGLFLLSPMLVFFKTKKKLSLLLVLSTLLVISSPYYLKSFFTLLPPSFQSRLNYWSISERIIADHPWLGTGTGSFEHEFIKRLDWDEEITKYAHNHWLQLASEAGLPASAGVFFITVVLLVFIPGSSHAEKKRTPDPPPPSYRSFILPFFVFSLFSLFYPAFTTFPLEYSWLFSLGIIILFWVCSFFFLHLSHSFHEKYIDQAMHFAAILFFLQSLVEFNQDTMGLSFLFYCLLGNKISHLSSPPTSPRRLSANSFSSLLFIGGLIIFSCVSGNVLFVKAEKQIHKTELISAEKTLRRASCLCPFNPEVDLKKIELLLLQSPVEKKSAEAILDLFYKALIKSPRQYDIWFLLAKYAYHHPQLTLLKKQALHAVNQAIQLAPTNPRLYLLKAQILEQYQKKQEALSLYLFVLKQLQKEKHHLHYAFSLSEKEIEWIKHQTALILSEKTEQGAA